MAAPAGESPGRRGMLHRLADGYFRLIEALLVALLGAMVLMVLGNVILRYGFSSGITVSEELSRFAFVWLVFLGAAVGMREGAHLGVDTLLRRLPKPGRIACLVLSELGILLCCVLFFAGTWLQQDINAGTEAPVTGLSMGWVYGVAYVSAGTMALVVVAKLWALATGQLAGDELIVVAASEEHAVQAARDTADAGRADAGRADAGRADAAPADADPAAAPPAAGKP